MLPVPPVSLREHALNCTGKGTFGALPVPTSNMFCPSFMYSTG